MYSVSKNLLLYSQPPNVKANGINKFFKYTHTDTITTLIYRMVQLPKLTATAKNKTREKASTKERKEKRTQTNGNGIIATKRTRKSHYFWKCLCTYARRRATNTEKKATFS